MPITPEGDDDWMADPGTIRYGLAEALVLYELLCQIRRVVHERGWLGKIRPNTLEWRWCHGLWLDQTYCPKKIGAKEWSS